MCYNWNVHSDCNFRIGPDYLFWKLVIHYYFYDVNVKDTFLFCKTWTAMVPPLQKLHQNVASHLLCLQILLPQLSNEIVSFSSTNFHFINRRMNTLTYIVVFCSWKWHLGN
mgnify:CR=1 FL=1